MEPMDAEFRPAPTSRRYSAEQRQHAVRMVLALREELGVVYDFEAKSSYSVTVTATDRSNATATVTINLTNVAEPPSAPSAPTVRSVEGSTTSLSVSWPAPANTGPAILSYDLRYRQGASGPWTNGPQNVTVRTAALDSLTADVAYQVQARAGNAEGDSGWSPPGTGTPATPTPTSSCEACTRTGVTLMRCRTL